MVMVQYSSTKCYQLMLWLGCGVFCVIPFLLTLCAHTKVLQIFRHRTLAFIVSRHCYSCRFKPYAHRNVFLIKKNNERILASFATPEQCDSFYLVVVVVGMLKNKACNNIDSTDDDMQGKNISVFSVFRFTRRTLVLNEQRVRQM